MMHLGLRIIGSPLMAYRYRKLKLADAASQETSSAELAVTTLHDNANRRASTASATRQNATPHAPQKQPRHDKRSAAPLLAASEGIRRQSRSAPIL
jgi:hypothetical protein